MPDLKYAKYRDEKGSDSTIYNPKRDYASKIETWAAGLLGDTSNEAYAEEAQKKALQRRASKYETGPTK